MLTACESSNVDTPGGSLSEYRRMAASDVHALQLVKLDSITLGTTDSSVFEITDLEIHDGNLFVVDSKANVIKVFDGRGRFIRTIGREGKGPGEFEDPFALAFGNEELYVVDLGAGKRFAAFDREGRFVNMRESNTPTNPISIAASKDLIVTMSGLTITDPSRQGWDVVGITKSSGEVVGKGCAMDPRYLESSRNKGMIWHFDFGSVAVHGDRIYCIQTISPVVQVMDFAGKRVEEIRVAPPFYQAPEDVKEVLNQKAIFDYLGTFTAHAHFFPVESGFISAYTRFDSEAGEVRYHLFACNREPSLRCGVIQNVRKPVYAASADTIYLEEEVGPNEPMRIGIYRLTRAER